MAKAIDNCKRDIVFSISPGGPETTIINHLRKNVNLWRISADFWDEWGSLKTQMDRCAEWAPFRSEGHWPDADMLPLGDLPRGESGGINRSTNFTKNEQITVMTFWSICRSPLMFGGNLSDCDDFTLELISNEEVLKVNQHSCNNRLLRDNENTIVWTADSPNGEKYVALFNTSEIEKIIDVSLEELNLSGEFRIRELWAKQELGVFKERLTVVIPPHGAGLYSISK